MSQTRLTEITKDYRQMTYEDLRHFVGERAGRAAVIQAQGEALRSRFDASQAAMQRVMDFVGFGPSKLDPDPTMYTYGINLGTGINGNGAKGMYVGYLSRKHRADTPYKSYAFSAHFVRDYGISSQRDSVMQDFGSFQYYAWAEKLGWGEASLAGARQTFEPVLDVAEETTGMLWNAIRDAELNPKLAVRLAAQEVRAARDLTEPRQA